jgi:CheY-like chemotaxis protein
MSHDGSEGQNAGPSCVYAALVKENPPRSVNRKFLQHHPILTSTPRLPYLTPALHDFTAGAPAGTSRARPETPLTPHPQRILCVDDDPDTCSMLCALLGLVGCETSTAGTAQEALEAIAGGRFDLYLLDNWLPGGGGVELCRRIRESDPSTPIVFYTGAAQESEREEALAAGAQDYLVKPGDVALLVETVRRLLR